MFLSRFPGLLVFALALVVLGAPVSNAQQPAEVPLKIGIVNMEKVFSKSTASKSILDQIGGFRKSFQDEIAKGEDELRRAEQELGRKRTLLDQAAFQEEVRKYQAQRQEFQQLAQQRRAELQKVQSQAVAEVYKAATEIIASIAGERNLTVILREEYVVIAATAFNISDETLTRLNARLPSVKVQQPGK